MLDPSVHIHFYHSLPSWTFLTGLTQPLDDVLEGVGDLPDGLRELNRSQATVISA